MNCDGIRGLLSAYLDGELSPGDLLRVEQHLRRCHYCADEVDALRQTVALVAALDEVEAPAAFHLQLHDRLVALGPTPAATLRIPAARPRFTPGRFAVPAAAAAAVLTIGLLSTHTMGNLPGQLVKSQFKQPVATNAQEPPAQGANTTPPATSGPATVASNSQQPVAPTQKPDTSSPAAPSGPAPLGTASTDLSKAGVATESTTGPGSSSTALAPQVHYQAKVALTADQIGALGAKYRLEEQNGGSFMSVPTAQFNDILTQIRSLPGAAMVGATQTIDIAKDIAKAQAEVQASAEQLKKHQAAYDAMSPADQAEAKAQLDADRQAAADAVAELSTLEQEVETSTIFLQVVSR